MHNTTRSLLKMNPQAPDIGFHFLCWLFIWIWSRQEYHCGQFQTKLNKQTKWTDVNCQWKNLITTEGITGETVTFAQVQEHGNFTKFILPGGSSLVSHGRTDKRHRLADDWHIHELTRHYGKQIQQNLLRANSMGHSNSKDRLNCHRKGPWFFVQSAVSYIRTQKSNFVNKITR